MSGAAADFPGRYPVLIGDRAFAVNTSYEQFRRQSTHHDTIPSQRESIDLTDIAGEGTINTEGLWRRGQISWHHGAGQLYLDRKESDDYRFYDSKGVDPWFQNQLSLLPDTTARVLDSTTYNWCTTEVIGNTVFHLQANVNPSGSCRVRFTTDTYATWTTPTGAPTEILEIASDGFQLYLCSPSGVYILQPDSTGSFASSAWSQLITDGVDHIWCPGDRVICTGTGVGTNVTGQNYLYDITDVPVGSPVGLGGTNALSFMNHPNPHWDWLDATSGEAYIYICGVPDLQEGKGGKSAIYQFSIASPTGAAIATAVLQLQWGTIAYEFGVGEFCGTLYAYLGSIYLGTNLGIREARPSTINDPSVAVGLIVGPAQPNQTHPIQAPFQPYIGNWVSGIVGYEHWIWFSWPQFDGTSWGLGRLDISTHLADLQPAYAPDLMVASTANSGNTHHTLNWCPFTNGPLMIVPGADADAGLYTQDYNVSIANATKYVASGTLRSGRITYGIPDMKTLAQANLKTAVANAYAPFDTAAGDVALDVAYDGASFGSLAPLAPNTQANPPVLVSPLTVAEEIEVEAILTAGSVSNTDDTRPFLTRWTIKSLPNVVSGRLIFVAVMLYVENDMNNDLDYSDPYGDYAYLENLRLSQEIITYKEGNPGAVDYDEATCVVQELYWMPFKKRDNADGGFEGDLVVTLKTIVG